MTTETGVKERPMLFSGEMVWAILEGRKTQTRRVIKRQPPENCDTPLFDKRGRGWFFDGLDGDGDCNDFYPQDDGGLVCPYGQPGDRLWVRERWKHYGNYFNAGRAYALVAYADETTRKIELDDPPYREQEEWLKWRPSIHMPRWASRLTLEITEVRVERLHHIGEVDAKAEGVEPKPVVSVDRGESYLSYSQAFADLWDRINEKRGYGWSSNCWVWVLEFRRAQ